MKYDNHIGELVVIRLREGKLLLGIYRGEQGHEHFITDRFGSRHGYYESVVAEIITDSVTWAYGNPVAQACLDDAMKYWQQSQTKPEEADQLVSQLTALTTVLSRCLGSMADSSRTWHEFIYQSTQAPART